MLSLQYCESLAKGEVFQEAAYDECRRGAGSLPLGAKWRLSCAGAIALCLWMAMPYAVEITGGQNFGEGQVLHVAIPSTASARLVMGGVGLGFLLGAELSLVRLRGLSPREYFATRDPVSGTVYYLTLGLFAAMPLLVVRR